ncbi:unnamed protein product [Trichogramma brassicae]|uniref:Uncharacterized protein n=1 Tax=Trichogramma brassicae TaxID=86971 RepID=A0A6H5IZW1_9HYME|nr:unnamed protein product [Trichogramma brassicae]
MAQEIEFNTINQRFNQGYYPNSGFGYGQSPLSGGLHNGYGGGLNLNLPNNHAGYQQHTGYPSSSFITPYRTETEGSDGGFPFGQHVIREIVNVYDGAAHQETKETNSRRKKSGYVSSERVPSSELTSPGLKRVTATASSLSRICCWASNFIYIDIMRHYGPTFEIADATTRRSLRPLTQIVASRSDVRSLRLRPVGLAARSHRAQLHDPTSPGARLRACIEYIKMKPYYYVCRQIGAARNGIDRANIHYTMRLTTSYHDTFRSTYNNYYYYYFRARTKISSIEASFFPVRSRDDRRIFASMSCCDHGKALARRPGPDGSGELGRVRGLRQALRALQQGEEHLRLLQEEELGHTGRSHQGRLAAGRERLRIHNEGRQRREEARAAVPRERDDDDDEPVTQFGRHAGEEVQRLRDVEEHQAHHSRGRFRRKREERQERRNGWHHDGRISFSRYDGPAGVRQDSLPGGHGPADGQDRPGAERHHRPEEAGGQRRWRRTRGHLRHGERASRRRLRRLAASPRRHSDHVIFSTDNLTSSIFRVFELFI